MVVKSGWRCALLDPAVGGASWCAALPTSFSAAPSTAKEEILTQLAADPWHALQRAFKSLLGTSTTDAVTHAEQPSTK
eukprot:3727483-Amphidinium_carterae.1